MRVGDRVLVTDPVSELTKSESVTALHRNHETELADIALVTRAGRRATNHTTQEHLFWNASTDRWIHAAALKRGDRLRSIDGKLTYAPAVHTFRGDQVMRNLTVANIHTYYVLAGSTPVLMHNTGPDCGALEGERNYDVHNPETGNVITDIDHVNGGVLREEKSALYGDEGWISRHIDGKVNKYLEARRHLPGYEDAPIGFRMTNPSIDPRFRSALELHIDNLRKANPGVDIRLVFAQ